MKRHMHLCFALWGFWSVGLCLAGISLVFYQHNNDLLFWKLVVPYNSFVQIISLVPVEPIFCISAVYTSKKAMQPYLSAIILFFITLLFWVIYITLYVWWTGGI